MANTRVLTTIVEDHVRSVLSDRQGTTFDKRFVSLTTGGRHEFDAVSIDGRIVASIKSASGRTRSGKNPSGKIKDCIAELYFLSLVDAPQRWLILTTPEFYDLFTRAVTGKVAVGIEIHLETLPSALQNQVDEVQRRASDEMIFPVLDRTERPGS